MQTARVLRLSEASLILLFFLGAARIVTAVLLGFVTIALTQGVVNLNFINAHLLVVAGVAISWFAPRPRKTLPTALALTAIIVAVARVPATVANPTIRIYAALVVFGFGGIYIASLIRANYRSFVTALLIAIILDQMLRAIGHTYDISLRESWLLPQIALSLLAIILSRAARARAKNEVYEPASLTLWNGLSIGAFLFLELALLAIPNVQAQWANVNYRPVAIWLIFASALTLSPWLRVQLARPLEMFDERARGWVWILLLMLLVVLGKNLGGAVSSVALVAAQVVALMMLWWVPNPEPAASKDRDQVGPAVAFGLAFFVILSYAYLLIFEEARLILPLRGQSLTLHLIAVVIFGVPLIGWRQQDPWHLLSFTQHGMPVAFAILVFIGALIATEPVSVEAVPASDTLRIASFDINFGYNPQLRYDIERTADFILVADADIVMLQRVDAGRQSSYGVDQALWLAQRLGMRHVYQPTIEELTGVAVLSRWPIIFQDGALLASVTEQMGVAHAQVQRDPTAPAIDVYSTRLSAFPDERVAQIASLLNFVGASGSVALGGDLRLVEGDDTYIQIVEAGNLPDSNTGLNIPEASTFPAADPLQRLDYIFLGGLTAIDSRRVCGPDPASDHCLIVIEVIAP